MATFNINVSEITTKWYLSAYTFGVITKYSQRILTFLLSTPYVVLIMSSNIRTNLQRALGCNYKALALFRITIGALLLCELLLRFRYLEPFYSDEGTLPLYLLLPKIDTLYKAVCIHSWGGSVLFQGALLGSQVFLALGVTIGYQTQIYAFLSWYLYLSLTLRNTWLAFILDRYFHYMLFFLAFLPSGEVWSVDALRKELRSKQARQEEGPVQNATICNLATVAIKMQILWIYLDAGIGKYMDPLQGWTFHASISALDTYTRHTVGARYVYALLGPFGLKLLTPVVVWIEILCVPICLAGLYKGYNRIVMFNVCVIVSLHLGISVTLRNTVLLSLVACSAWCVYIPPNVFGNDDNPSKIVSSRLSLGSKSMIIALFFGCLWFELLSNDCTQSVKHIYSNLLHNRWNGKGN